MTEIKGNSINNSLVKQINTNADAQASAQESAKPAPSQGSGENVSFTQTAELLRNAESKIAEQPVVDTQKVEAVKKAIAEGTYEFDASKTAENIAAFENLLDSKTGE